MFGNFDLGASTFKNWNDEQRRDEIAKLVLGYRAGVPLGILCKMSETIAGSVESAREHLTAMMPLEERKAAVERETGGMRTVAERFLL